MGFRAVLAFVVALGASAGSAFADTFKAPSDDYPTIQSAIDAAGLYDTVVILAGDHDESPDVNGKSYLKIKGQRNPILNGLSLDGCDHVLLSGFTVSGGGTGISIVDCSDSVVTKVKILGASQYGIYLETCARTAVTKVVVTAAGIHGILDNAGEDIVVSKCVITDCGGDGIRMSTDNVSPSRSDRAIVSKNRISGCLNGITAGGDDLVIEKNRLEAITTRGIHVKAASDSHYADIEKNRIVSEETIITAIEFVGVSSSIHKNVVEGGVIFESGSSNHVDRNKVSGSDVGIVAAGNFVTVFWNSVRDSIAGIQVYGAFSNTWANKVLDVGNGIEFHGFDPFTTGNRVTRASAIGFYVAVDSGSFYNDRCTGSGVADLADVNAEGVNSYTDCRFGVIVFNYVD